MNKPEKQPQAAPVRWRDHLPVHPAAKIFPLLRDTDPAALHELADDIAKHGLREKIDIYEDPERGLWLLDGRNRADALELIGEEVVTSNGYPSPCIWNHIHAKKSFDPYAYVVSKNLHRRHLTTELRRDLIATLLKAKPEASNRQVAKQVKADDKTVAKVRAQLESRSEIPNAKTRTDTKGRKQPARKPKLEPKPTESAIVLTPAERGGPFVSRPLAGPSLPAPAAKAAELKPRLKKEIFQALSRSWLELHAQISAGNLSRRRDSQEV